MKELIGKTVNEIWTDKTTIIVRCSDGDFKYVAEGDCCSVSWVEHMENVSELIGATILSVESVERSSGMTEKEIEEKHECLDVYGDKAITDKGYFILEYRNESNGYYSGWMEFEGKVEFKTPTDLKKITEDF